jgi:MFS family permease
LEFPDKQEKYLGYYNMAIGLGTCSGPLIGSLLYIVLPYGGVFGCFAALIFFSGLIAAFVVPKRLNAPNLSDSMAERGENHN